MDEQWLALAATLVCVMIAAVVWNEFRSVKVAIAICAIAVAVFAFLFSEQRRFAAVFALAIMPLGIHTLTFVADMFPRYFIPSVMGTALVILAVAEIADRVIDTAKDDHSKIGRNKAAIRVTIALGPIGLLVWLSVEPGLTWLMLLPIVTTALGRLAWRHTMDLAEEAARPLPAPKELNPSPGLI